MSAELRIELGRLVRPIGIRGEVKLLPYEDFWPETLASGRLSLEGPAGSRPVKINESRPAGSCLALKLEGIGDRDAAESLRESVLVLEGELDVPPPESIRPFQVIGFEVREAGGGTVGRVIDLQTMPAQPLLTVKGPEREHDIPFVSPILRGVDWEAGVIEVDLPAGLLDL